MKALVCHGVRSSSVTHASPLALRADLSACAELGPVAHAHRCRAPGNWPHTGRLCRLPAATVCDAVLAARPGLPLPAVHVRMCAQEGKEKGEEDVQDRLASLSLLPVLLQLFAALLQPQSSWQLLCAHASQVAHAALTHRGPDLQAVSCVLLAAEPCSGSGRCPGGALCLRASLCCDSSVSSDAAAQCALHPPAGR